jgi:iron complex transport system substrate-binding protein
MKKATLLFGFVFIYLFMFHPWVSQCYEDGSPKTPLDMETLQGSLSCVRGETKSDRGWPRIIEYEHDIYDFRKDALHQGKKTFVMASKPVRIIPHAVGVSEILWAICPRERLIAFNEFSADPEFSFIADLVKKRGPIFRSKQTELVIGYQPDLVFTVFYSGADLKEKLKQAKISYFDLGYFGTIESIKKQALLIGRIIGEEGNAEALVKTIDETIRGLRRKLPSATKPIRVLYYGEGGYIPGKSSNFESICHIIGSVNVGSEQGIKSWSQIDYETLLKWDPDVIIVPHGSHLRRQLMTTEILAHAMAIRKARIYEIPRVYLGANSQFILLSANLLAGIVYEEAF